MFKKFVALIVQAQNPLQEVFYRVNGINDQFKKGMLLFEEAELLFKVCEKIEQEGRR